MTRLKDQLRLEIETTPTPNPVLNPNGELGPGGWRSGTATITQDTTGVPIAVNGSALKAVSTSAVVVSMALRSVRFSVLPGEYVGATGTFYRAATSTNVVLKCRVEFRDSNGLSLGTGTEASQTVSNGSFTLTAAPSVAPAGTATAEVVMAVTTSPLSPAPIQNIPVWWSKVAAKIGASSGAAAATWTAPTYVEVIGKALSLRWSQGNDLEGVEDKITPGLLTASVRDATLDPAANTEMYRGRLLRVSALVAGVWTVQAAMTVTTFSTSYERNKVTVTITATDAAADLGQASMDACSIGSLGDVAAAVVLATGVVGDDGASNSSAYGDLFAVRPMSYVQGSKATDWLLRAGNTYGGYCWIDKRNVTQARTLANLPTASTTFSDNKADTGATFYTDIDPTFSTESIVNRLTVNRINLDEKSDGNKTYGPYLVPASIRRWGAVDANVEILEGVPVTVAGNLLKIFATPGIFARSITFNATKDITKATALQLYQKILVKRGSLINASYRLLKISHEVKADNDGGSWITTIELRPLETGQPAVTVVSPVGGPNTGPEDTLPYTTSPQAAQVTLPNGTGAINSTVVFPKPYPPGIIPSLSMTSNNGELTNPRVTSLSETGFTVRWDRSATGVYAYMWLSSVRT